MRGLRDPVRLVFDAAPGDAVILSTADLDDRFRSVATEGEVVAEMTGTELLLIEGDTTVGRLRQELCLNQANHHLARGF